jgi:NADH dehydrogenase/NADH:ubiquinone oxidoreductase subunit G
MYERIVVDPKRRLLEDIVDNTESIVDAKNIEELADIRKTKRNRDNKLSNIKVVRTRRLSVLISCAILLTDNMMIFTNTKRIKKMRESIVEFLLANHPLDCPIRDQGGDVTYKI